MPQIIYLEQTNSTNYYLRKLMQEMLPEEGTTVVADFQTAGRGQKGNSWESEKGKNLMFSTLLYPRHIPAKNQFMLSQVISLAIIDYLNTLAQGFTIKWPNDIYRNDKKVAGILIENDLSGNSIYATIVGIGMNVNQHEFLSDAPNPISLAQIIGKELDRDEILNQILQTIFEYYDDLQETDTETFRQKYADSLYRNQGYHRYSDSQSEFEARFEEILETGHLVLIDKTGAKRIYDFKEVNYLF